MLLSYIGATFVAGNRKGYKVAKTHRMPYVNRSFSAKEPYY